MQPKLFLYTKVPPRLGSPRDVSAAMITSCGRTSIPYQRHELTTMSPGMRLSCGPRMSSSKKSAVLCACAGAATVSYTHLRAHETKANLVCRLLLEKKKK